MNRPFRWFVAGAVSMMAVGCATPAKPIAVRPRPSNPAIVREDACAARMHDLSQPLLLFFLKNQRLPNDLAELKAASDPALDWTCPVTHRPYVYDRVGFYDMEHHTRVVLYDPTPAHLGMRWAVQLDEPRDAKTAVVAEVVLKPESMFIMRPPK